VKWPGLPDFSSQNLPQLGKYTKLQLNYQMAKLYTKWPNNIPNGQTIYQMAKQYTKWPNNIPNVRNIFQMAIEYANLFPFLGPPKFTQIGIFGLKIYHRATLVVAVVFQT
jgi:hypothetical protein